MVGHLSAIDSNSESFLTEGFSYDALGQRIRVRTHFVHHNQSFYSDELLLFTKGVMYEISYRNQTCTKAALKMPFPVIEIPQDATLLSQTFLGSSSGPGQGLLVNVWTGELHQQKEIHSRAMATPPVKYLMSFTEIGCVPVSIVYYTDRTDWNLISFFDLVLKIEDPQEFVPPDFCDTTKPVEEGEEVVTEFYHALFKANGQKKKTMV
ncbi:ependymin-like isoform X2 [Conger conger]|nr:ependymin-like isoform X2 [Conger conger]